jgi:hypothetical protein
MVKINRPGVLDVGLACLYIESMTYEERQKLIEALMTEDPNGCYSDEDAKLEFGMPHADWVLIACAKDLEIEVSE